MALWISLVGAGQLKGSQCVSLGGWSMCLGPQGRLQVRRGYVVITQEPLVTNSTYISHNYEQRSWGGREVSQASW